MSDAQQPLFNTRCLSSAREVNAMKRAKEVLPYKRVPPVNLSKTAAFTELFLPDEDRVLTKLYRSHCPSCNAVGPELLRWRVTIDNTTQYAVRCPRCDHGTEPCESSKKAVELWKITSKLMK